MNKIISISVLLGLSFNVSAQGVHLDISNTGSGIVFSTFFGEQDTTNLINLFKKGEKAYNKQNFEKAKEKLVEFVSINTPYSDSLNWKDPGYKFTQMKNTACRYLKYIALQDKEYTNAIYYHKKSKKDYYLYRGQGICGNGALEEEVQNSMFMSYCYEGLGDYDKAISVINDRITWAINKDAEKRVFYLLKKKVGTENVYNDFVNSVNNPKYENYKFYAVLDKYSFEVYSFPLQYNPPKTEETYENGELEIIIVQGRTPIPPTDSEVNEQRTRLMENYKDLKIYKLITEN